MDKFLITFWKEPYNAENSFVQNLEYYITTAEITKSSYTNQDIYHVKLNDIGLYSKFGTFDIVCQDGFWSISDTESAELNFLKWNIVCRLISLNF